MCCTFEEFVYVYARKEKMKKKMKMNLQRVGKDDLKKHEIIKHVGTKTAQCFQLATEIQC